MVLLASREGRDMFVENQYLQIHQIQLSSKKLPTQSRTVFNLRLVLILSTVFPSDVVYWYPGSKRTNCYERNETDRQ